MSGVLVSHPHAAAVAKATAEAFERAGQLSAFFSGVSAGSGSLRSSVIASLARWRPAVGNRLVSGVPDQRVHALWATEASARLVGRLTPSALRGLWREYDAIFVAHDLTVSLLPWPARTDTVYAYEDGALLTFQRAARRGIARVWDLPLPHWATLEAVWRDEFKRWAGTTGGSWHVEPDWKKKRKDAELALADQVSVASKFTRQSLEAAGCRKPILVAPYGFPLDEFRPKQHAASGPFTVLAVGSHDLRKGTGYLLEAWSKAALPDARLRLIGQIRLPKSLLERHAGRFEHVSHLPRSALETEYQAAHLLAFPTLGDGFGLVIQEAMCCATPVLTTPCGGGPECINSDVEGWIAPARSVDALVDYLRFAASHRDALHQMGLAARHRAESMPWETTSQALVEGLKRSTEQV